MKQSYRLALAMCPLLLLSVFGSVRAEDPPVSKFLPLPGVGTELGGSNAGPPPGEIAFNASLTAPRMQPGEIATLAIHAVLPPRHYTYSISAKPPYNTTLKLTESFGLEPIDERFTPDAPAKKVNDPIADEIVYKHQGDVVWLRKFRIAADANLAEVSATATLNGQYCGEGEGGLCRRIPPQTFRLALTEGRPPVSATAAAAHEAGGNTSATSAAEPAARAGEPTVAEMTVTPRRGKNKDRPDPLTFRFQMTPADAAAGETVTVSVTTTLDDDWHIFALTQNPANYGTPTKIVADQLEGLEPLGEGWQPDSAPREEEPLNDGVIQHTHYNTVTWSRQFVVSSPKAASSVGIGGTLKYQICSHGNCLPPKTVKFGLGSLAAEVGEPVAAATGVLTDVEIVPQDEEQQGSLALYLLYSFLGGLLLNVMPCVLPVIAIKVLSFVQQAGESRARIFALNATYSAGVISVFLLLAALAAFFSLGWGGLFQSSAFNLAMACVVFAMGLSLLGVFEIPVPGLVGSAAGQHSQEGLTGAFLTGVFATLLATPCTGPFMSSTLAWSVQQSTLVIFLVWGMMGLGMASPYLVFGLVPGAVRILPKPGAWMERFKELAGFVLMATVIFFIYFLDRSLTIPLLIMLLGIALAVWMVGNLYDYTASARRKWTVRTIALLAGGGTVLAGYSLQDTFAQREQQLIAAAVSRALQEMGTTTGGEAHSPAATDSDSHLAWQPFSEEALEASLGQRKTVLIDFTADWCLICKQNEKIALNTEETRKFVEQHGIVPLYADYTKESPEIKAWLDRLRAIGVPLTAIFPGDNPGRPILLRGPFTRDQLLEKLRQAVESSGSSTAAAKTAPQIR